jgi:hypothetical protein
VLRGSLLCLCESKRLRLHPWVPVASRWLLPDFLIHLADSCPPLAPGRRLPPLLLTIRPPFWAAAGRIFGQLRRTGAWRCWAGQTSPGWANANVHLSTLSLCREDARSGGSGAQVVPFCAVNFNIYMLPRKDGACSSTVFHSHAWRQLLLLQLALFLVP